MFVLDKTLARDSEFLADLDLCQLRIIKDSENPWLLLIPKIEDMVDWSDLDLQDQLRLTQEIDRCCKFLKSTVNPDKLNVASLGNQVPQLHIHIIARFKNDRAWPGPIWGTKAKTGVKEEFL